MESMEHESSESVCPEWRLSLDFMSSISKFPLIEETIAL
jgi:hypothetical protein